MALMVLASKAQQGMQKTKDLTVDIGDRCCSARVSHGLGRGAYKLSASPTFAMNHGKKLIGDQEFVLGGNLFSLTATVQKRKRFKVKLGAHVDFTFINHGPVTGRTAEPTPNSRPHSPAWGGGRAGGSPVPSPKASTQQTSSPKSQVTNPFDIFDEPEEVIDDGLAGAGCGAITPPSAWWEDMMGKEADPKSAANSGDASNDFNAFEGKWQEAEREEPEEEVAEVDVMGGEQISSMLTDLTLEHCYARERVRIIVDGVVLKDVSVSSYGAAVNIQLVGIGKFRLEVDWLPRKGPQYILKTESGQRIFKARV